MTGHVEIPVGSEDQARRLSKFGPRSEDTEKCPGLPVESHDAIRPMTVNVQVAVGAECQTGAVLIDLITRGKHVNEVTGRAVIPQYGIAPLTVDIQVAIRPEGQRGGFGQAAAAGEDINATGSSIPLTRTE